MEGNWKKSMESILSGRFIMTVTGRSRNPLLLASRDLPDAFFGSICLKDTDIAQNKDYFLELTGPD